MNQEEYLKYWQQWQRQLKEVIIFKEIRRPADMDSLEIREEHITLAKECKHIWDTVPVYQSVNESIEAVVGEFFWEFFKSFMREQLGDHFICIAYFGSFFNLPRWAWKYTESLDTRGYPFQPFVDLWDMGLVVARKDEKTWALWGKDRQLMWKGEI